jgi:NAD(P)-dependent dehydrogenase (short-subunit alcohol dehydrogenase family)
MNDFAGRVALVTGTTGIGRATALRLAAGGAQVLACGIEAAANTELAGDAGRLGLTLHAEACDVTDPDQVQAAVAKAASQFGGLDIIVNAAAIHPFGTVLQTDMATWNRCMAVNVGSIYLTARFGIPEMKKRGGGAIVSLSSVQGYACQRGVAVYAASKGAVHSLTRALALDHAGDKIRVNSISPGSIETPMLKKSAANFAPDVPAGRVFERWGQAHPLGRIGTAEEVAELVAFLASDKAGFCTGSDYVIDGGLIAGIAVQ